MEFQISHSTRQWQRLLLVFIKPKSFFFPSASLISWMLLAGSTNTHTHACNGLRLCVCVCAHKQNIIRYAYTRSIDNQKRQRTLCVAVQSNTLTVFVSPSFLCSVNFVHSTSIARYTKPNKQERVNSIEWLVQSGGMNASLSLSLLLSLFRLICVSALACIFRILLHGRCVAVCAHTISCVKRSAYHIRFETMIVEFCVCFFVLRPYEAEHTYIHTSASTRIHCECQVHSFLVSAHNDNKNQKQIQET